MKFSRDTTSSFGRNGSSANGIGSHAHGATTYANGTTRGNGASRSSSKANGSHGTATTADGTAEKPRTLSETHAKALEDRGLDAELAVRMGWHTAKGKFAGRDGLAIPMVREGRVINHKYRGPGKAFQQDPEAPRSLWNEDVLRDETLAHLPVMICEGEMDGLAGVQVAHGVVRTVSVIDGASTNLDFLAGLQPLLEKVPRFILAGDGDGPGQKLNAELARRLGAARCAWLEYPTGKDLNDVLRQSGASAALSCIQAAKPYPITGLFRLSDFPDQGEFEVFDTGWPSLNPYLKLWVPELMLITGIPAHGKSKFALHMLANQVEKYGKKIAVFSAEVPIKPHIRDELRAYHGGETAVADVWIEQNFVFMAANPEDPEEVLDIDWVIEKAGDAVIRYGISWVLIDPWNQVEHRRDRQSLEEYQEAALRKLNRFRRAFGVGVVVVAHPTKDVRGKDGKLRVPNLYDVSGSAHWYNAPDHGVVLHRKDGSGTWVQVFIRKSRFTRSGATGQVWLQFDMETGRYASRARGPDETEAKET